jgi:tetratricopeptide (TPR) repeat protein
MFNALGVLGVTYVPDPHNPYVAMSKAPRAVDTVHYPGETLAKRTGDCDDTTILMAALLANVGIPTKIVDVPGHLFLLVDTGLHERNRLGLRLDPSLYVVSGDGVWIPLETTALDKGFSEAWRIGADQYRSWEARGLVELVDVGEAQGMYPPSEPPAELALSMPLNEALFQSSLSRDAAVIGSWHSDYMDARYAGVSPAGRTTAAALNELARVYFLSGRDREAIEYIDAILEDDPASPAALNNKANILAVQGDGATAVDHYERALDLDPGSAGIHLNLGVVLYAYGDTSGAAYHLTEGVRGAATYEQSCALLGLKPEVSTRGETPEDEKTLSAEELRLLLKSALDRLPGAAADTTDSLIVEPGAFPSPTKRPAKLRIGASRGGDRMVIRDYLYWKD